MGKMYVTEVNGGRGIGWLRMGAAQNTIEGAERQRDDAVSRFPGSPWQIVHIEMIPVVKNGRVIGQDAKKTIVKRG